MEANTRNLARLFDNTIQYQIPLFQRPYVWTRDAHLSPLWEDIQGLLDKHLRGDKAHPHFLGAIVLEQLPNPAGAIESRQVIDGQQRFTTLQILLIAARDHASADGNPRYIERFEAMVANGANRIDQPLEAFKVWPTNSDRPAFKAVWEARSSERLRQTIQEDPALGLSNIALAYHFFHERLASWIAGALDDEQDEDALSSKGVSERLEAIWQVVHRHLQLVVIDLDKDDETQVIFETLNARGQELLPADLIKNLLFRRATAAGANVDQLYDRYWKPLETPFWRGEVQQGRLRRPRIDVFINYYLTMMTRDEVKSASLFNEFKAFVSNDAKSDNRRAPPPSSPTEHIAELARYAKAFAKFGDAGSHARLASFIQRLDAIDTTTVFPFILYAHAELMPDKQTAFDGIVDVVESFLMRRMICGLTPKNYNRLFVDLLRHIDRGGELSAASVAAYLAKGDGDSVRFPDDAEVTAAAKGMPLYNRLAQFKIRAILAALDAYAVHDKNEFYELPDGLQIEHVMPTSWTEHWKLPADALPEAAASRTAAINTLGNLTLINGSLNPALSNSSWDVKRPELLKFSRMNLTRYFHDNDPAVWDEAAIGRRADVLIASILDIWKNRQHFHEAQAVRA